MTRRLTLILLAALVGCAATTRHVEDFPLPEEPKFFRVHGRVYLGLAGGACRVVHQDAEARIVALDCQRALIAIAGRPHGVGVTAINLTKPE